MAAYQYKALIQPIFLLSQPATTIQWYQGWDIPAGLYTRQGLSAHQQQFLFGPPVTANAPPVIVGLGWLMPTSQPVLRSLSLWVDNGIPEFGTASSTGTALPWFRELSQPVLYPATVGAWNQPFFTTAIPNPPLAATRISWYVGWDNPVLRAGFPYYMQPTGTPTGKMPPPPAPILAGTGLVTISLRGISPTIGSSVSLGP